LQNKRSVLKIKSDQQTNRSMKNEQSV